jgi:hypothetical protein
MAAPNVLGLLDAAEFDSRLFNRSLTGDRRSFRRRSKRADGDNHRRKQ